MKDATLEGYRNEHERPPAFTGPDGGSYTVAIMTDRVSESGVEGERWGAYLFFLEWRGQEAVHHLESDILAEGSTEAEAREAVGRLTLHEAKEILDRLVGS